MSTETSNSTIKLMVLKGDGIGPEITAATLEVLSAVGTKLDLDIVFEAFPIGLEALEHQGTTVPDQIFEEVSGFDGVILGPVSNYDYPPKEAGGLNPSGELRKRLDLYANIRPALTPPGFAPPYGKPVDLVVVRENTEGFYADRSMFSGSGEFMPSPDMALSVRKITRQASTRIATAAFEVAMQRPRKKVTAVHKANVLRAGDGLFLDSVRAIAKAFPDVTYEEKIVDAMAALLIRDPSQFDVVVTTNMFGDILSDQASELAGSLGMAASLNSGPDVAVAQAQHGSAPDIAGQGIANPSSLIGSAGMLLNWLADRRGDGRLRDAAALIETAISTVIAVPAQRTADLGGNIGTAAFTRHLVEAVRQHQD
jgi:3-isopropylmalate dehydrogenase